MFFIDLLVFIANIWDFKNTKRVSGQSPPREIAPRLGLGFGWGLGLELGLGGNFSRGREIVLESTKMLFFKQNDTFEETQFWKVGVVTLKLYSAWQRSTLCQMKNDFYWLIYFHCEYLSAEKFENVDFERK